MRYGLDDMYGMLNEYREQDEKHVIQKQEKASHGKKEVSESHLTEKSVPATNMSGQQENPSVEERCYQEKDYEAVVPADEKYGHVKPLAGIMRVADTGFRKDAGKESSAGGTCALRDIPKCLVEMAKKIFLIRPTILPWQHFCMPTGIRNQRILITAVFRTISGNLQNRMNGEMRQCVHRQI